MERNQRKKINIGILFNKSFPNGQAATNRFIALSKGINASGNKSTVLITKATEANPNTLNSNTQGVYERVTYKYSSKSTYRKNSSVLRLFQYLYSIINSFIIIHSMNKKEKIDALIITVYPNYYIFLLFIFCKTYNIKLIQERSEFSFINMNGYLNKIRLFFYTTLICKLFYKMIVINNALKKHYSAFTKLKCDFHILPMMVEPERFTPLPNQTSKNKYIAYCGSMTGNKDGVPILINAFSQAIQQIDSNIKLYLIGDTGFKEFKDMTSLIKKLNLTDKIIFTGRKERHEIPMLLANSALLALARPANKQAEGGFPIKLGEYLATGKPVLVTSVGEIPCYIKHHEHAYLAKPSSINDFANKIIEIFSDYNTALKIGQNGKLLTETIFNYKYQGNLISNFIIN